MTERTDNGVSLDIAPDGLVSVSSSALNPEPAIQQGLHSTCAGKCGRKSDSGKSVHHSATHMSIPPLSVLAESYQNNAAKGKEGYVTLFGKDYRVTHPISSFGMESFKKK